MYQSVSLETKRVARSAEKDRVETMKQAETSSVVEDLHEIKEPIFESTSASVEMDDYRYEGFSSNLSQSIRKQLHVLDRGYKVRFETLERAKISSQQKNKKL